ncbi:ATP-dependent DNA ligase [Streptomyces sp. NPDC046881]|uniref:ATP-dependent DNA ligase n=1 Tax=Streptomyces sp. NPDC046881 TaxID=3155374 RepID=UPI0033E8F790
MYRRRLVFAPGRGGGPVLVQSRRGALIQDRFPDLVAAAERFLPGGLVLDGELLVVLHGGEPSFEALQRRTASRGRSAVRLAAEMPAYFVAFDVLQAGGEVLLAEPYTARRARLEQLFTEDGVAPPWLLCRATDVVQVAREWLTTWTQQPGVEGLVIKGRAQHYLPGVRGWLKVRRRDTTEAIVGAITGTLARPGSLLLGRYDAVGALRAVARSTPLRPETARHLAAVGLTAAGPGHPWEGVRFTASWGSRTPLNVLLVEPSLVAEIEVDTAQDRGVWRHPVRVVRLRDDVPPGNVTKFGEGAVSAAG